MTEGELQAEVRRMCEALHLDVNHFPDSRGSWSRGFPDLVIVGKSVLWRELKSRDGTLTPFQRRWGSKLTKAGQDWQVWRPRELTSGLIAAQLTAISSLAVAPNFAGVTG